MTGIAECKAGKDGGMGDCLRDGTLILEKKVSILLSIRTAKTGILAGKEKKVLYSND